MGKPIHAMSEELVFNAQFAHTKLTPYPLCRQNCREIK
jgi:hypothetical protein